MRARWLVSPKSHFRIYTAYGTPVKQIRILKDPCDAINPCAVIGLFNGSVIDMYCRGYDLRRMTGRA